MPKVMAELYRCVRVAVGPFPLESLLLLVGSRIGTQAEDADGWQVRAREKHREHQVMSSGIASRMHFPQVETEPV